MGYDEQLWSKVFCKATYSSGTSGWFQYLILLHWHLLLPLF